MVYGAITFLQSGVFGVYLDIGQAHTGAMVAIVKSCLNAPEGVLPGPIKLQSKAATVFKRAQDDQYQADRESTSCG
jgi:hypothetical protein